MTLDLNLMERILLADILDIASDHLPIGYIDGDGLDLIQRVIKQLTGGNDESVKKV